METYVKLTAMADWQRRVWDDITAVDGVIPPSASRVLVVGDGLPVDFAGDVRVITRAFGEAMGDETGFHRIIVLAHGAVEANFGLLLRQMWPLLRPDGLLVLVAARPSPWGVRYSVWWRGHPRRRWLRWLKKAHWLVAEDVTVGFCGFWGHCMPFGGAVRVILAQKRVAGTKIMVRKPDGVAVEALGVPV